MGNNKRLPRITSQVSFTLESELKEICDHIDFSSSVFHGRGKRNRSLGSTMALITEIALTDPDISPILIEKLKRFMVNGGKHYTHSVWYMDKY